MLTKDISKRKTALEKRLDGMTFAEIGKEMGVSRQRVEQWLRPPAEIRELVYKLAGGECENCGIKLNQRNGQYHSMNPEIEEFTTYAHTKLLCIACHRKEHHI